MKTQLHKKRNAYSKIVKPIVRARTNRGSLRISHQEMIFGLMIVLAKTCHFSHLLDFAVGTT